MAFITEDFLLTNPSARRLYHTFAEHEPILDYHCHLPPREIAENRRFQNLTEVWLNGDHYKWRAMRANGVEERYCTGDADPFEKFLAWSRTVPFTLRNPLYHWTHLELKRYFGIDDLLSESTACSIWDRANEKLQSSEFSTQGILTKFRVKLLCTTDDPADDLACHRAIRASSCITRVLPAYRPDKALQVHDPEKFNAWVDRLAAASNIDIRDLNSFHGRAERSATMSSIPWARVCPIMGWTAVMRRSARSRIAAQIFAIEALERAMRPRRKSTSSSRRI